VVVLESGFASADSALASDDLIWADAPVLPGVDPSLSKGLAALPGEGTLDAGSRVARWYKTAAEDPIFIDVNSVKSYLQWTRTGTTITSASGHGAYGVYQGTFSTWYKDYVYYYNTWNSALATTYTYGKFYNWDFWDNDESTWVLYNTNRINGYGNGGWTNEITRSKWGENNWLLHWKDSAGVWWL